MLNPSAQVQVSCNAEVKPGGQRARRSPSRRREFRGITPLAATRRADVKWKKYFGKDFDHFLKEDVLVRMLRLLQSEGKLGRVVVDVGSGGFNLAFLLRGIFLIRIDCALRFPHQSQDWMDVRANVELAALNGDAKRALFWKIERFLRSVSEPCGTIVFSDFLNYVDSARVLKLMSKLLPPGGRIVIFNAPERGFDWLFSPARFKTNSELAAFLRRNGFEIEHVTTAGAFQKRCCLEVGKVKNDDHIILVAEKIR